MWEPFVAGDVEVIPVPFHGEQDEPGAEIDHYTYVLRAEGLTVYGGVDSYRDTFGEMLPVLGEVRERFRPEVAFLPVSKMVYAYETGGVNGFCRAHERQGVMRGSSSPRTPVPGDDDPPPAERRP